MFITINGSPNILNHNEEDILYNELVQLVLHEMEISNAYKFVVTAENMGIKKTLTISKAIPKDFKNLEQYVMKGCDMLLAAPFTK